MARVNCTECGRSTGSFSHTEKNDEGHGIKPVCDPCLAKLRFEWGVGT